MDCSNLLVVKIKKILQKKSIIIIVIIMLYQDYFIDKCFQNLLL